MGGGRGQEPENPGNAVLEVEKAGNGLFFPDPPEKAQSQRELDFYWGNLFHTSSLQS